MRVQDEHIDRHAGGDATMLLRKISRPYEYFGVI